jgi:hypothetical protein
VVLFTDFGNGWTRRPSLHVVLNTFSVLRGPASPSFFQKPPHTAPLCTRSATFAPVSSRRGAGVYAQVTGQIYSVVQRKATRPAQVSDERAAFAATQRRGLRRRSDLVEDGGRVALWTCEVAAGHVVHRFGTVFRDPVPCGNSTGVKYPRFPRRWETPRSLCATSRVGKSCRLLHGHAGNASAVAPAARRAPLDVRAATRIVRFARQIRGGGYQRIVGELSGMAVILSATTVHKILRAHASMMPWIS